MTDDLLAVIRKYASKGLALGNQKFTDKIEQLSK